MKLLHKEIRACLDCPYAYFGDLINDSKHFICRKTSKREPISEINKMSPRCPLPDVSEFQQNQAGTKTPQSQQITQGKYMETNKDKSEEVTKEQIDAACEKLQKIFMQSIPVNNPAGGWFCGVGFDDTHLIAFVHYKATKLQLRAIPCEIDGVKVEIKRAGPYRAF